MLPFTIPSLTHWEWSSSLSLNFVVKATGEPSINEKVFSLTTVEMSADPSPVVVTTVVTGTSTAPSSGMMEISPVGGGGTGFTVRLAGLGTPPYTAEIVTAVEIDTETVVTVNVVLALPAGTVTLAGTVAAELLLDSNPIVPPAGAAPLSVTVPVEGFPPTTEVGFMDRETSDTVTGTGFTVRLAGLVTPPYTAEIVTAVEFDTETVVTVNVVLALPAGTVTLAGTVAAELLLDSDTIVPPAGAAPLSVTVPVEGFPPTTEVGFKDRETSDTAGTGLQPTLEGSTKLARVRLAGTFDACE